MTEPDQGAPATPFQDAHSGGGEVRVLCAGAVQGLLTRLAPQLHNRCGADVVARFSAVGALRDALLSGEECDVLIVTDAMVRELGAAGHAVSTSCVVLGQVATGIAVRRGDVAPDVSSAAQLSNALLACSAIHLPDPLRATAGVHFTAVMRRLGVLDALADRLRTYPNGATAMRALADSTGPGHLGCTQTSEIMFNNGVQLVAGLPAGFELSTTYSAVVATRAQRPAAARALLACLADPALAQLRADCGIELPSPP